MEHQTIDLVLNNVSNAEGVSWEVCQKCIACNACTWTQDDVSFSFSLILFLFCSHFLCLESIVRHEH